MHVALVPPSPTANTAAELQQELVILWSRHITPAYVTANGAQPGMETSVAALFDAARGTYESKPMPEYPFCSGQSHLA